MMNSAVRLLDSIVETFGDKIAIEDAYGEMTYKAYHQISRKIGSALIHRKAMKRPVVVYLPKTHHAIACFMGAMYSGSPYVPVDSKIPMSRLEKIVSSLKPCIVITNSELYENLSNIIMNDIEIYLYDDLLNTNIDDVGIESSLSKVIDTDPIYIMYTSGSTGTPKGVVIPHRGILDYSAWVVETFKFDDSVVMGNQAPFFFDNSTFDIYGCLRTGGKLVLIPEPLFMFPSKLPEYINEKKITTIFWVPTIMINVANSGVLSRNSMPTLKTVAFCGEVMPNKQLNIWRRTHQSCLYANLYGPTEITDVCSYYIVDALFEDFQPLPIGEACENMRIVLIDDQNALPPIGEQGEICVMGSGVALGYWNNEEVTQRAFVRNPLNTHFYEKMYRTGDLAYINDENQMIFCGRKDNQIKLKGNRIELGEIESAAMCLESIENVCAIFNASKQEIVLFIETQQALVKRKVLIDLKNYVPSYMIPSQIVFMEKLPYTDNDKIDRVALSRLVTSI